MKDHSACMCVCVCSVCVHSSHVLCVPVRVLIIKNKHVSLPVAETLCKANKVVHANVSTAVYSLTVRIKGLFVLFLFQVRFTFHHSQARRGLNQNQTSNVQRLCNH